MQREIFTGGVAPGSPNNQNEIKTLLCYLLSQTEQTMTFEQLHTALSKHDLVNYFELVGAIDSLVESNHLIKTTENKTDFYIITELGKETAATLDTSLPYTVREKAVDAAQIIVAQEKRLKEVKTSIVKLSEGGFKVELSIPGTFSAEDVSIISFSVYAPTEKEALNLEKGFLNDPIFLYQSVTALLLRDIKVLGDLKPSEDLLFK